MEERIKEKIKVKIGKFIDYAGLFFIGFLSLGYLLYCRRFAKLHIDLSFIRAPFFVGDITFVICGILFLVKWFISRKNFNTITYLLLSYSGFIVVKTIVGYINWGPLALRHSVLFCYPLFAFFSYSYYRRDFFEPRRILLFTLILISIFAFSSFYYYFVLTCFALSLILIDAYPNRLIKYALYCLLLLTVPYKLIFNTSRTFLISNLLAIMYMSFGFLIVSKIKMVYKFIFSLLLVSFVFYGLAKNTNPNEIRTLTGSSETIKRYNKEMEVVRLKEPISVDRKFEVRLYNENRDTFGSSFAGLKKEASSITVSVNRGASESSATGLKKEASSIAVSVAGNNASKTGALLKLPVNKVVLNKKVENADKIQPLDKSINVTHAKGLFTAFVKELKKSENIPVGDRGVETPYTNSLFRIVIWKDAFKEMFSQRSMFSYLFGFDFGKPFRSRALEILGWGGGEWSADGWVCMHNSYIDIIYRAGIVGIAIIVSLLIIALFLIKESLKSRSLTGFLLTGALLNWFIAANFLEILEMPYSAIPLWSLFGLTFAYFFKNKTQ